MSDAKFRRFFFFALVFFFLATTPVVILYNMGYRFSFERGIFIYSGSITIKSNPQEVEIFIDQKPVSQKKVSFLNNSYHIDGIRPGEYLLEIKAPGFNSWSKKISVSSGISTEFWNVILTRNEYEKTGYGLENIDNFFLDPDKALIAWTENKNEEIMVKVTDVKTKETKSVFSSLEYKFIDENIEWSPKDEKIIIPTAKNETGEKHYFIVDYKTNETANLKDLAFKENIGNIRWDSSGSDNIFYASEENLYKINIRNPRENRLIAENIASYNIASGYVFYLKKSNRMVYRANPDSNNSDHLQITNSPLNVNLDSKCELIAYDEKRIIFISEEKLFIFNDGDRDEYFKELSGNVKSAQFSDDGKKLLFWNDWEIFVYFMRDWEVQPWRKEDEKREVTRFSQKIDNVQWTEDYEHVLFNVDRKIKITDIDNRYQLCFGDIVNLNIDQTKIAGDFSQNKAYFIDGNAGISQLYSIIFPEDEGIF